MGCVQEVKHISDLSRSYRLHVHDELSVALVWSGSTVAVIDGTDVPISSGSVVLIAPGVAHACNPMSADDWTYTLALMKLDADAMHGRSHLVMPSTTRFRRSFQALRNGQSCSDEDLLLALAEAMELIDDEPIRPFRSTAMRRVMAHLRSHVKAPLSLDDLAVISGLSKYHLVRSFKRAYGLTPHAYLLNMRVNEAKNRLKSGEPLADVALECGFYDQSHFTRVFARCVGMSPASYQKMTAISSNTARCSSS